MKGFFVGAVLAVGGTLSVGATAQELPILAGNGGQISSAAVNSVPEGVTLREIFRAVSRPNKDAHITLHYWPQNWEDLGWRIEGTLGFISSTQFPGSAPLYNCFIGGAYGYFSSTDGACEGNQTTTLERTGFISQFQIAGTVPLHRCVFKYQNKLWHHYDTLDANCEGHPERLDGILGYVFL